MGVATRRMIAARHSRAGLMGLMRLAYRGGDSAAVLR
jgi:hypothetical protein